MYVSEAQAKQGQQHYDCLLLVPGYIKGDGQPLQLLYAQGLAQPDGHEGPRVAVVTLPGVEHARQPGQGT